MVKWFVLACNTPNLTKISFQNLMNFFFYLLCKIFIFIFYLFFLRLKLPWKCLNATCLRQSKQNKNNFAHIIIICAIYWFFFYFYFLLKNKRFIYPLIYTERINWLIFSVYDFLKLTSKNCCWPWQI